MSIVASTSYFLVSQWLWLLFRELNYLPLNGLVMFLLLKLTWRISFIRAITISYGAQLFSVVVLGILAHISGWLAGTYVPNSDPYAVQLHTALEACLNLGMTMTIVQWIYFGLLRLRFHCNMLHVITVTIIANCISTLLLYYTLPHII